MKISLFLIIAAAALQPTLALHLSIMEWDITGPLQVADITFPINIANAPHKRGYYFAQQFRFYEAGLGYTGLQPQYDDRDGTPTIRAVFSNFIDGATTNDPDYCTPGADGGPGVSCGVIFEGPYEHTYNLEIRNTKGTTWNGTVVDTVTGKSFHIGSYTLPLHAQHIEDYEAGFVEYFGTTPPCKDLPYTSVAFGVPTTKSGGKGSLQTPEEIEQCAGVQNFHFVKTDQWVNITAGFLTKVPKVPVRLQYEGYFGIDNGM